MKAPCLRLSAWQWHFSTKPFLIATNLQDKSILLFFLNTSVINLPKWQRPHRGRQRNGHHSSFSMQTVLCILFGAKQNRCTYGSGLLITMASWQSLLNWFVVRPLQMWRSASRCAVEMFLRTWLMRICMLAHHHRLGPHQWHAPTSLQTQRVQEDVLKI